MIKKIIKIGNSVGVTLDKFILTELDWSGGDFLELKYFSAESKIVIRKLGQSVGDQRKTRQYLRKG